MAVHTIKAFSIDAAFDPDTVRKQQSASFRQVRKPPFCLVVNPSEPQVTAEALANTIRGMLYRCGCPVFLYIDDEMHAYVIPEDRPIAQQWVREHFGWLVGVYGFIHRVGHPMLRPTLAGVEEDMREHLSTMGWLL
jgi:hypothetical protein